MTPNDTLTLRIGSIFIMTGKFLHDFLGYIGCSYDVSATLQDPRSEVTWVKKNYVTNAGSCEGGRNSSGYSLAFRRLASYNAYILSLEPSERASRCSVCAQFLEGFGSRGRVSGEQNHSAFLVSRRPGKSAESLKKFLRKVAENARKDTQFLGNVPIR